jgi:hypothetical protein
MRAERRELGPVRAGSRSRSDAASAVLELPASELARPLEPVTDPGSMAFLATNP